MAAEEPKKFYNTLDDKDGGSFIKELAAETKLSLSTLEAELWKVVGLKTKGLQRIMEAAILLNENPKAVANAHLLDALLNTIEKIPLYPRMSDRMVRNALVCKRKIISHKLKLLLADKADKKAVEVSTRHAEYPHPSHNDHPHHDTNDRAPASLHPQALEDENKQLKTQLAAMEARVANIENANPNVGCGVADIKDQAQAATATEATGAPAPAADVPSEAKLIRCAIVIQTAFRDSLMRLALKWRSAAIFLQASIRCYIAVRMFQQMRRSAVIVQAIFRRSVATFDFAHVRGAATLMQLTIRRFLAERLAAAKPDAVSTVALPTPSPRPAGKTFRSSSKRSSHKGLWSSVKKQNPPKPQHASGAAEAEEALRRKCEAKNKRLQDKLMARLDAASF